MNSQVDLRCDNIYRKLKTEDHIAILTSGLFAGAFRNDNSDCFRRFEGGPADPAIFQWPNLHSLQ